MNMTIVWLASDQPVNKVEREREKEGERERERERKRERDVSICTDHQLKQKSAAITNFFSS